MNCQRHDYDSWNNLAEMLCDRARDYAKRPCVGIRRQDKWTWLSYGEVSACVSVLSRHLRQLGLEPGGRIALASENRPEWVIADFAIMAAGGISVPHYMNVTAEDHCHLLTDSGAMGVIASGDALRGSLGEALSSLDKGGMAPHFVITLDPEGPHATHQADFSKAGGLLEKSDLVLREPDDLACLIYTQARAESLRV